MARTRRSLVVGRSWLKPAAVAGATGLATIASASGTADTPDFAYEASGRLAKVARTGPGDIYVAAIYNHDKAGDPVKPAIGRSFKPPPP
jgi:hypothetical protein